MGLFSPSIRKINTKTFKKSIKSMPKLSKQKKAYIQGAFGDELKGGLTEREVMLKSKKLMRRTDDPLKPAEVQRVKKKLLKEVKGS